MYLLLLTEKAAWCKPLLLSSCTLLYFQFSVCAELDYDMCTTHCVSKICMCFSLSQGFIECIFAMRNVDNSLIAVPGGHSSARDKRRHSYQAGVPGLTKDMDRLKVSPATTAGSGSSRGVSPRGSTKRRPSVRRSSRSGNCAAHWLFVEASEPIFPDIFRLSALSWSRHRQLINIDWSQSKSCHHHHMIFIEILPICPDAFACYAMEVSKVFLYLFCHIKQQCHSITYREICIQTYQKKLSHTGSMSSIAFREL